MFSLKEDIISCSTSTAFSGLPIRSVEGIITLLVNILLTQQKRDAHVKVSNAIQEREETWTLKSERTIYPHCALR